LLSSLRVLSQRSKVSSFTPSSSAMAWRLTGDRRHFDRCVAELDAACGLQDWHPPHFLDTAEMAMAVAIGLDWLHDDLHATQRRRYREALESKAIAPARLELANQAPWTKVNNNWTQVCASGIALACLAAAADQAELDASPSAECLALIDASKRFYVPDGCYPEGPAYWDYGTSYHVAALATLASHGRQVDVPLPLLASTGFMAHACGPTGTMFNFADAPPVRDAVVAARCWLAARTNDDAIVADLRGQLAALAGRLTPGRTNDRFFPLHLLWLPAEPTRAESLPLAAAFAGEQPMAAFRSSWSDPDATFVAVKGGTPKASHGHMDVGSFVVESGGRRWIHDLGSDNYNLPGYFHDQRWNYFRTNARSHNVILIDDALPHARSMPCQLVAAVDEPPFRVRIDLGPAYAQKGRELAAGVVREVSLDPATKAVSVRDVIDEPVGPVRWQVMVDVEPAIAGDRALLASGTRGLTLTVDSRPTASGQGSPWRVEPARPPTPEEKPNLGFWLLSLTIAPQPRVTIDVTIRPVSTDTASSSR
jgi:hypothetical protein